MKYHSPLLWVFTLILLLPAPLLAQSQNPPPDVDFLKKVANCIIQNHSLSKTKNQVYNKIAKRHFSKCETDPPELEAAKSHVQSIEANKNIVNEIDKISAAYESNLMPKLDELDIKDKEAVIKKITSAFTNITKKPLSASTTTDDSLKQKLDLLQLQLNTLQNSVKKTSSFGDIFYYAFNILLVIALAWLFYKVSDLGKNLELEKVSQHSSRNRDEDQNKTPTSKDRGHPDKVSQQNNAVTGELNSLSARVTSLEYKISQLATPPPTPQTYSAAVTATSSNKGTERYYHPNPISEKNLAKNSLVHNPEYHSVFYLDYNPNTSRFTFGLINDPDLHTRVLGNANNLERLKYVCEIRSKYNTYTQIRTVQAGSGQLQGDKLIVTQKAIIELY